MVNFDLYAFSFWKGGCLWITVRIILFFMYLSVIRINISEPNENCTDIRQNEIQRHSLRAKPAAFLLVYKFFTFVYTQNGCLVFFMQTQKKLTRRIKKSIGNFSAWKESKNEREWRKKANTTNQTHNHKLWIFTLCIWWSRMNEGERKKPAWGKAIWVEKSSVWREVERNNK